MSWWIWYSLMTWIAILDMVYALSRDIKFYIYLCLITESDNVEEFMDNLYAKRDMVVEDERRWPFGEPWLLTSYINKLILILNVHYLKYRLACWNSDAMMQKIVNHNQKFFARFFGSSEGQRKNERLESIGRRLLQD